MPRRPDGRRIHRAGRDHLHQYQQRLAGGGEQRRQLGGSGFIGVGRKAAALGQRRLHASPPKRTCWWGGRLAGRLAEIEAPQVRSGSVLAPMWPAQGVLKLPMRGGV